MDLPAIHPIDGAMVAAPAQVDAMSDELVIAAADWITRFGSAASRMFSAGSDVEPEMEAEGADSPSQVRQIAMTPDGHLVGEGRVQAAHFETPLVVGMASVLAMRYHQPFRRWIDRRRSPSAVSQTKPLKGPHWKI